VFNNILPALEIIAQRRPGNRRARVDFFSLTPIFSLCSTYEQKPLEYLLDQQINRSTDQQINGSMD
jgi:hypothetical protein